MGRVRAHAVLVDRPALDDGAGLRQSAEDLLVQAFVAELAVELKAGEVNLSSKSFCCGLSGAMWRQSTPVRLVHSSIAQLVISVPLSLTMVWGLLRRAIRMPSRR